MTAAVRDSLFGETVVRAGLCTPEQVAECLNLQEWLRREGKPVPRLGEILAGRKYLNQSQLDALLGGSYARQSGRFGEVAVRLGLCFSEGVQKALERQSRTGGREQPRRRIGELLVEDAAIEQRHIGVVLEAMGLREAVCASCGAGVNVPREGDTGRCPACGRSVASAGEEAAAPLPEAPEAQPEDVSRIAEAMGSARPPAAPPAPGARTAAASAPPSPAPAAPARPAAPEKPAQFAGYEILAKLGANATGGLYLARKGADAQLVTLKIFSGELSSAGEFARNFKAAARDGVGLKHPAINRVVDAGRDRGRVYCASEYVKGRSLRYLLETQGRLKAPLALGIAKQLAVALEYAHSRGVVHGDLKPSNVIVGADAAVKVANFGIVTNPLHNLLAVSKLSGSAPIYAAPELAARDASPTAAADIYSLGATLYHMVTGRPPVAGSSPLQALARLAEEPIKPPSAGLPGLPQGLDRLVGAMLALEPAERPANMREVIQDLTALGAGDLPAARTASAAGDDSPAGDAAEPAVGPAPASRRGTAAGTALVATVVVLFLAAALTLLAISPDVPPLPEVRALPKAAPDAPALKEPAPAKTPEPPKRDGPRRPIGG